jgi:sulfur carrier protein ThiS
MVIELALFAHLARYHPDGKGGRSARPVDAPDGTAVGDLIAGLGLPDGPRVVLVNGRHAGDEHQLADGDRLAIFPPIAGG